MTVQEAKDFLVEQAEQQAALDRVPLSDLEKRMMYFTESEDAVENPIALNDAFEEQYDSAEYEAKVSRLFSHARARVKEENPETARRWNEAVQVLEKGDHYLLLLLDRNLSVQRSPGLSTQRLPYEVLELLGIALSAVLVILSFVFLAEHYNLHINTGPTTHKPLAARLGRLFIAAMVIMYLFSLIQPWVAKTLRK